MKDFELLPSGATQKFSGATPLAWERVAGSTTSVNATIGWDLHELGGVSSAAGDLLRIAAAAFLADRLTTRGLGFTRSIRISVHVVELQLWSTAVLAKVEHLLRWLTGDDWKIRVVREQAIQRPPELPLAADSVDEVTLLSGGLDSFCGAVDRLQDGKARLFIGHTDGASAVQHAQQEVRQYIMAFLRPHGPSAAYQTVTLSQVGDKKEASTRSRSLLFMSLATAAASARSCGRVVVPENGYTSANLPLNTARGGALSTRSTHPTTFLRLNDILTEVGIEVRISNPYQGLTKGEFVALAASHSLVRFEEAVGRTLSCGKLDGTYYKGGNPNYACGLCVPCIVRRSSILAGGIQDYTPYLVDTLEGDALLKLRVNRKSDVDAVREATQQNVDDTDIMSIGPWPDDINLDDVVSLCNRGHRELRIVPDIAN